MSEIVLPLFVSTTLEKLIGLDGGEPQLPVLKLGDTIKAQVRTFDEATGTPVETFPVVRNLTASLGKVLDPPTAGSFHLKLGAGGTPFGPIALAADADTVKAAFNAAALGFTCEECETEEDDSDTPALIPGLWLLRFDNNEAITTLQVATNALRPESFVRWRPFQIGDVWWHELRLIQTALAWNAALDTDGNTFARILAPSPSVREIRRGGDPDNLSDVPLNEVQALTVPVIGYANPFSGTYVLSWQGRQTRTPLGIQAGAEEIAAALNGMFTDGKTRFKVTIPVDNEAWIEFTGPLEDTDWHASLITVTVKTFRPGLLTFILPLTRSALHAALRRAKTRSITRLLELELEIVEDGENPDDVDAKTRTVTIDGAAFTIVADQIFPEAATIAEENWLRPPIPRDYLRHTGSQVKVGNQAAYEQAIGNGVLRSFSIPHNRGTANGSFSLRENTAGGRYLTAGEYTVTLGTDGDNEFILDFPAELDPPTADQYIFTFLAVGGASAYAAHTHTIDEVFEDETETVSVRDLFDALNARLTTVEEALPATPMTIDVNAASGSEQTLILPPLSGIFGGRFPIGFNADNAFATGAGLANRPPAIFPAFHVSALLLNTGSLPSATASGGLVYRNNTGADITLPGGLGWRGETLASGGWAGSDGRRWVVVNPARPVEEVLTLDFTGKTGDDVGTTYIRGDFTETRRYLWFKRTGDTDPAPSGDGTGFEVDINGADDGTALAVATKTVLNSIGFTASNAGAVLTVRRTKAGWRTPFTGGTCPVDWAVVTPARTSFYPAAAERELFTLPINDRRLRAGQSLTQTGTLELATLKATTRVQLVLVVETGTTPSQSTPATTAENLQDFVWNTQTPLLLHRVLFGSLKLPIPFGVSITLAADGETFTANALLYGKYEAAATVPADRNFALRARLIEADTENSVSKTVGYVYFRFSEGKVVIA